jgi:bacillopeptidase F (M6 metalloprotease family)
MKQWLTLLVVVLFSVAFTACSNTEDSKSEQPGDKNPTTEAVNMIANDEKIIEMLKKKGEIPEDASQEEIAKALQKYLKNKAPGPGSLKDEKEKQNYINKLKEEIQKNNKE